MADQPLLPTPACVALGANATFASWPAPSRATVEHKSQGSRGAEQQQHSPLHSRHNVRMGCEGAH